MRFGLSTVWNSPFSCNTKLNAPGSLRQEQRRRWNFHAAYYEILWSFLQLQNSMHPATTMRDTIVVVLRRQSGYCASPAGGGVSIKFFSVYFPYISSCTHALLLFSAFSRDRGLFRNRVDCSHSGISHQALPLQPLFSQWVLRLATLGVGAFCFAQ